MIFPKTNWQKQKKNNVNKKIVLQEDNQHKHITQEDLGEGLVINQDSLISVDPNVVVGKVEIDSLRQVVNINSQDIEGKVSKGGDTMNGSLHLGEHNLILDGEDSGDIIFSTPNLQIERGRIFTRAGGDSCLFLSGSSIPSQDVIVENGNLGIRLDCTANTYISYHNESGHMSFGSAKTSGIDEYLGGMGANWFSDNAISGFWRDGSMGIKWWGITHNGIRKVHYDYSSGQFYINGKVEVTNSGLGGWWDYNGCAFLQNSRPWVGGGNLTKLITGIVDSPNASANLHYGIGFQNQDMCIYSASPEDGKLLTIRLNHLSGHTAFPGTISATNVLGTYDMISKQIGEPAKDSDMQKLFSDLYKIEFQKFQMIKSDFEDFNIIDEKEYEECKKYMIQIHPTKLNNRRKLMTLKRPSLFKEYD